MDNSKPATATEQHLKFLDALRQSDATNVDGAEPYLREAFPDLSHARREPSSRSGWNLQHPTPRGCRRHPAPGLSAPVWVPPAEPARAGVLAPGYYRITDTLIVQPGRSWRVGVASLALPLLPFRRRWMGAHHKDREHGHGFDATAVFATKPVASRSRRQRRAA